MHKRLDGHDTDARRHLLPTAEGGFPSIDEAEESFGVHPAGLGGTADKSTVDAINELTTVITPVLRHRVTSQLVGAISNVVRTQDEPSTARISLVVNTNFAPLLDSISRDLARSLTRYYTGTECFRVLCQARGHTDVTHDADQSWRIGFSLGNTGLVLDPMLDVKDLDALLPDAAVTISAAQKSYVNRKLRLAEVRHGINTACLKLIGDWIVSEDLRGFVDLSKPEIGIITPAIRNADGQLVGHLSYVAPDPNELLTACMSLVVNRDTLEHLESISRGLAQSLGPCYPGTTRVRISLLNKSVGDTEVSYDWSK
ncbi:hypothetical protein Q5752_002463 [Cryptotrichosporon argae]